MSVQQIIAQLDNILAGADVSASAVLPSSAIRSLGMTRQGTGLALLEGPYTGDEQANYDIEIVSASGTGSASTPRFSGVGSGSLSVTQADIPVQEVTLTLITPPYPGAAAECMVGADVLRAALIGNDGNRIRISVSGSGIVASPSGCGATLENIAIDQDELTAYLWENPLILAATDLSGNVPADAPRLRFGVDPQVYRVIKDYRGGAARTVLTPPAVRAVPKGSAISSVSGAYIVTVTGEGLGVGGADIVETYPGIISGYDLLLALMSSSLIRPAYPPSPVTTPGGNARTDLPVITESYALIDSASIAAIRPGDLSSRPLAVAETVLLQSRGNGSWTVTGSAAGPLPDAREGVRYAPAESPILLTIPARPAPEALGEEPVTITGIAFASRTEGTALPNIYIDGRLGINASTKTISAVYTRRPDPDDCTDDAVSAPMFSASCLGLDLENLEGGDEMSLDEAYQTRLVSLYAWQREFLSAQGVIETGPTYIEEYVKHANEAYVSGSTGVKYENEADFYSAPGQRMGIITPTSYVSLFSEVAALMPSTYLLETYVGVVLPLSAPLEAIVDAADIRLCRQLTSILADCLSRVWNNSAGLEAWDTMFENVQSNLTDLTPVRTGLAHNAPAEYISITLAEADYCLACAGIVPGKTNPAGGSVTGCWQDNDAEYYWALSDGYAPAFTNLEYYSTRAGSYENTMEFAFQIRCGCEGRLVAGDRLDIAINGNQAGMFWGSSEKLEIMVIPSSPLRATGGLAADDGETWSIAARDGSGDSLPSVNLTASDRHYTESGLTFDLPAGGIPYEVGDRFEFSVEGGTFRWRRDAGAWSPPVAIADDAALERGLTASFLPGPAPSFYDGDLYQFQALQEASATAALAPGQTNWQWPSGAGVITILSDTPQNITALAITHELPAGATCTVEISANGSTWGACPWFTGAFTLRDNLHLAEGVQLAIRGLRLTFSAPGSGVRWIWAGTPFQPQYNAALKLRRQFDMTRARTSGAAALLAEGTGASMAWEVLSLSDAAKLAAIVRAQKIAGDIPLILVPHILHPEEAILCKIDNDNFEITDEFNYEPDNSAGRLLSASLELTPEWYSV
jgi:hypothetical protein